MPDDVLTRDAALLADTVRDARALSLSLFRTDLINWTKGASSPVSAADIAVDDLLDKRLRSATTNYGSLAVRLCLVAQGSLETALAGVQSRDWDLAAANLIVQEANGNMTALSGDAISYNRREVTHGVLVAAGRDRHARIVEHFRNRPLP